MDAVTTLAVGSACLDAFAPLDWQWQVACRIHTGGRRRRQRPDPEWLVQLLALRESLYPTGQRRWRIRTPVSTDLLAAYQLHHCDSSVQWELEARVLAGQSDAEIGASMEIPAAVVTAFAEHFFHVRDRLTAGDFILFGVIGYDPVGGFREGDLRTLWCYFAFAAGPKFFELVMAVSQNRPLPAWAVEQAPDAAAVDQLTTVVKATITASTGSLTLSKLRKLHVLQLQLLELEPKRGANTLLSVPNVPGGVDYWGFSDLVVMVETPAPAASQTDSGESAPVVRGFAEVA
jgi:hypothetical protein